MSTASNTGTNVKVMLNLKVDVEDSKHYYKTRLVKITKNKTNRKVIYQRDWINIKMIKDNEWPTWTINLSALAFKGLSQYHYDGVGFRHKSIVDLKKTSTTFIYESHSDQPWDVRTIVWTHQDYHPFNRPSKENGIISPDKEHELTGNLGYLKYTDTTGENAEISWTENFITTDPPSQTNPLGSFTETSTTHTINYLLTPPTHTKYPSSSFYWSPSDKVGIIYDNQTTIPGKDQNLDSQMFVQDTWQKLPGLVEYRDVITRGGATTAISCDLKYAKNTYMTVIWQSGGRHSGSPYPPPDEESKDNTLILDIIHTLYWSE
jgi:hypothetical protein